MADCRKIVARWRLDDAFVIVGRRAMHNIKHTQRSNSSFSFLASISQHTTLIVMAYCRRQLHAACE